MKFFKYSFLGLLVATFLISCAKEYSSEHLIPAEGNWHFTSGGTTYSGYLDTIHQTFGSGSNVLYIQGKSNDGSQHFQIALYGNTFPPGPYYASQFQNSFAYNLPAQLIFRADQSIGEFVVNLNTLDSAKIEGTFSGTAIDSTDQLIQITDGGFSTY